MVSVAPNGGRKTKANHAALPISANELARCAAECRDAGASLIHVHVRDREGEHLLDADAYAEVTTAIRREVGDGIVVQITTESLGKYSPAEQIAIIKTLRPESASIALRELVRDERDEDALAELLAWMNREEVVPQFILYDQTDQLKLADLQARSRIDLSLPVLFVLGRYTAAQTSSPADLLPFIDGTTALPPHWSVCAFGRHEAACVVAGALLGGNVRVGFENNLLLPSGEIVRSNAASVSVVAQSLSSLGLPLETADGLRETFSRM
ncbi:3-keto-5-aminohexanoate cleavage protein [Rhizobium sp. AU243]|uniref:3-keto-5-aminohexanoate cleavage protein n=1 Tax=Rhizobium sp. AU243 TaxID=2303425 RepID=UPI0010CAF803|nr:3-keto-5-aminohexanoate cleavage protein [Rhizobium sp. AU243]TKV70818.1 3-keto-5-aminohexanoate cleavage protein [Rhizobium sp. AU243]